MLLPTHDKEARDEVVNITQKFIKDFESQDTGNYPVGILSDLILNIIENLGYHKGLPTSIEEALNSGDGVYRP